MGLDVTRRMRSAMTFAWISVVVLASLSVMDCANGSGSPLLPTLPGLAFTPGPAPTVFVGSIVDSTRGNGSVTISIATASGLTSGTWNMSFGQKADPGYIVSGTVSGAQYAANLTTCLVTDAGSSCSFPSCAFSFSGTFSASGLSGTYASTDPTPTQFCPARTGTISTTKQ